MNNIALFIAEVSYRSQFSYETHMKKEGITVTIVLSC